MNKGETPNAAALCKAADMDESDVISLHQCNNILLAQYLSLHYGPIRLLAMLSIQKPPQCGGPGRPRDRRD